MDGRVRNVLLLAATVPVSSLAGLGKAMATTDGWPLFLGIWEANLWGDLVFALGTIAAGLAVLAVVRRGRHRRAGATWALAVPLSFLLHWAVYACAWTFTGEADHFWSARVDGFPHAWDFTWTWGWPGLLLMAALGPALALAVRRMDARAAAAAPAGPDGERQVA